MERAVPFRALEHGSSSHCLAVSLYRPTRTHFPSKCFSRMRITFVHLAEVSLLTMDRASRVRSLRRTFPPVFSHFVFHLHSPVTQCFIVVVEKRVRRRRVRFREIESELINSDRRRAGRMPDNDRSKARVSTGCGTVSHF